MAYYLIKYLDVNGKKNRREFEGDTKFDAIENSRIDADRILSVNKSFNIGGNKLAIETQELIISEVKALAYSGQAMHIGVINILKRANIKKLSFDSALEDGSTISNILATAGISKPVVALIASGESSGRLHDALSSSMVYLHTQKKIKDQVKSPFTQSGIIILISFAMLMFLPKIIAPALNSLTSTLHAETNFMTSILLFIHGNDITIWIIIISIVGSLFLFKKKIRPFIRKIPVIKILDEFFVLKRSALLLMIFKPLFESGISISKSLIIIRSSMESDTDVGAVQMLIDKMNDGDSLSSSINNPVHWSPIFYNSFASFEKSVLSAQLELIDSVTFALLSRLTAISTKISSIANLFGKFLGFLALLLIIVGYYFPSLTASV